MPNVSGDRLLYAGNGTATVRLRGVHVRLTALWDYEPPPGGGDTHEAVARGTVGRVEVRPGRRRTGRSCRSWPPTRPGTRRCWLPSAAAARGGRGSSPGCRPATSATAVHVEVPDHLRVGHEAHFAAVVREFAHYFHNPRQVPAWERPNLLTKYYLTTRATEIARAKQGRA